jgi:hypothetical protein
VYPHRNAAHPISLCLYVFFRAGRTEPGTVARGDAAGRVQVAEQWIIGNYAYLTSITVGRFAGDIPQYDIAV